MILKSDNIQRKLAAILMMPKHVQYYLQTCALALLFFFCNAPVYSMELQTFSPFCLFQIPALA